MATVDVKTEKGLRQLLYASSYFFSFLSTFVAESLKDLRVVLLLCSRDKGRTHWCAGQVPVTS